MPSPKKLPFKKLLSNTYVDLRKWLTTEYQGRLDADGSDSEEIEKQEAKKADEIADKIELKDMLRDDVMLAIFSHLDILEEISYIHAINQREEYVIGEYDYKGIIFPLQDRYAELEIQCAVLFSKKDPQKLAAAINSLDNIYVKLTEAKQYYTDVFNYKIKFLDEKIASLGKKLELVDEAPEYREKKVTDIMEVTESDTSANENNANLKSTKYVNGKIHTSYYYDFKNRPLSIADILGGRKHLIQDVLIKNAKEFQAELQEYLGYIQNVITKAPTLMKNFKQLDFMYREYESLLQDNAFYPPHNCAISSRILKSETLRAQQKRIDRSAENISKVIKVIERQLAPPIPKMNVNRSKILGPTLKEMCENVLKAKKLQEENAAISREFTVSKMCKETLANLEALKTEITTFIKEVETFVAWFHNTKVNYAAELLPYGKDLQTEIMNYVNLYILDQDNLAGQPAKLEGTLINLDTYCEKLKSFMEGLAENDNASNAPKPLA